MRRTRSAIAVLCVLAASCAARDPTAPSRPDVFWYAYSEPSGAVVQTSLGLMCVTPCRLEIPRQRVSPPEFTFDVTKVGYQAFSGRAEIYGNPSALLYSDQGFWAIRPNPYTVELTPIADDR